MRRILGLLVILGLGGMSSYFILTRTNFSSYDFPDFIRKNIPAGSATNVVLTGKTEAAAGKLSGLLDSVAERSEEIIEKAEEKIKEQVFKIFKDTIDKKIETVGESLGVEVKRVVQPDSESPIVFGVKTGIPAYFSIQNRERESIRYEVDWRDGTKDGARLESGKEEVLSHKWEKAGNYLLKFKIINFKGEKIYNISITIL
ncbi:MAG: hypothetical protein HZB99_00025 [Candidatus Harrisonbacteria bacterium]|nr:hypothetical protein [Candidatus Harrisonbacteria bacterium]